LPIAVLAERRRHVASSSWLGGVFDLDAPGREADACDCDLFTRATANFVVAISSMGPLRLRRALGANLDAFAIKLLMQGSATGRAGLRRLECRAGDVVLFDLLQSLEMEAEAVSAVTLWAPRSRVLAVVEREEALHGLTLSAASPAGALVRGGLEALAAQSPHASAREFDCLADGVLAMLGKVIAPLLHGAAAPPLASFLGVRRYIDRNLRSPDLNADAIAKIFGLSRAALYRLFAPVGGVASYIRDARLQRAYREIVDPDCAHRRIGAIAYGLGFTNLSAFDRRFRDAFGASPREARAGRRAAAASPSCDEGLRTLLLRLGRPPNPA